MKKLIVLLSLNILIAQVPNKISFQAYLTDAKNMPDAAGSYETVSNTHLTLPTTPYE